MKITYNTRKCDEEGNELNKIKLNMQTSLER